MACAVKYHHKMLSCNVTSVCFITRCTTPARWAYHWISLISVVCLRRTSLAVDIYWNVFLFSFIGKPVAKIVAFPKYDQKAGDCNGNDLGNQRFKLPHIKQCASKCASASRCIGFVWNARSNLPHNCYLKQARCSTLRQIANINTYYKKGM